MTLVAAGASGGGAPTFRAVVRVPLTSHKRVWKVPEHCAPTFAQAIPHMLLGTPFAMQRLPCMRNWGAAHISVACCSVVWAHCASPEQRGIICGMHEQAGDP